MQNYRISRIGLAVMLGLMACNAIAHHALVPHFDQNAEVVIEGAIVTELALVNPHAYIYFDVRGGAGEVSSWRCELRAATMLRRSGWTEETLVPGQIVTIKGFPARREDNVCAAEVITLDEDSGIGNPTNLVDLGNSNDDAYAAPRNAGSRPTHIQNGQPNISGDWLTLSFTRGGLGGQLSDPNQRFDPTEANLAAAEDYDERFDDPVLMCHPINIIQGWNHDVNVNRITQLDDRVILNYGFVDFVRTIYLDAEHPDDIEPSVGGHSVGSWEDDVLVVDTVGFLPGLLSHHIGVMHSRQMHIIERFYYDSASGELVREYVVEDSLYLASPYAGQDRQGISAEAFVPFDCTELSGKNNIRSEQAP